MDNNEIDKLLIPPYNPIPGKEDVGSENGNGGAQWEREWQKSSTEFTRPIRVNVNTGRPVDSRVVSFRMYNCFNYSLFMPDGRKMIKFSIGVTSPNSGEGKSTVVSNLGAALSIGSGRKTVIVDFNLVKPQLHEIFGTNRGPGLMEALVGEDICIAKTEIENLYVFPAGAINVVPANRLTAFRGILSSLFTEFDFVLVDLPSVAAKSFPTLIVNQLSGLIVVIESKRTKRRDLDKVFRRVHEKSILGFVMNRMQDDDYL